MLARSLRASIAASTLFAFAAWAAPAQAFNGSDVLKWDRSAQDSFFRTSVDMVGMVAAQIGRDKAGCVSAWYYGEAANPHATNDLIRAVLERLPNNHPQATILALIQKECGKLNP